ncbi:MAG TPA: Ig-like domain-containing protein [Thermoanaerobaculia bacterium]
MKRNVILAAIAVTLLALAPVPARATPFGSFGGKVGGGNGASGLLQLQGWALADGGIAAVDILVDGVVVGRAQYGRARPQVQVLDPGFPDSPLAGYAYELNTTHFLNGNHPIQARAKAIDGSVAFLPPARVFQFGNTAHDLVPFGQIEFPNYGAQLFGHCLTDPKTTPRRYSVVSGYALDAGVQDLDTGIGYLELLIDGAIAANTRLDCTFDTKPGGTGGYTDCYGLPRPDIDVLFPGLKDGPTAGFRFVLDIGALVFNETYQPGRHLLSIRAGDAFTVTKIAEMPVVFLCDDQLQNQGSIGAINIPRNGLLYSGTIQTSGWALDFDGVQLVDIFIDGVETGVATYGLANPYISGLYPSFPDSAAPGWTFALDTTTLSNGTHFIQVFVRDTQGVDTLIGKRSFVVANTQP